MSRINRPPRSLRQRKKLFEAIYARLKESLASEHVENYSSADNAAAEIVESLLSEESFTPTEHESSILNGRVTDWYFENGGE